MQLGRHLHELWRLRIGVAISAALAVLVSVWSVYSIGLIPPRLAPRSLEMGSASTTALIDNPRSLIVDLSVQTNDMQVLTNHTLLVSNVMASKPVRDYIARRARVPDARLSIAAPATPAWPRPLAQSGNKKTTRDILKSPDEYRLSLRANPTVPIIDVLARAPSAEAAEQLANAAITGTQDYLNDLAGAQGVPPHKQVRLQQLGRAEGELINAGVSVKVALLAFLIVFCVSCLAVLFIARVRRGWDAQVRIEASAGQRTRAGNPRAAA